MARVLGFGIRPQTVWVSSQAAAIVALLKPAATTTLPGWIVERKVWMRWRNAANLFRTVMGPGVVAIGRGGGIWALGRQVGQAGFKRTGVGFVYLGSWNIANALDRNTGYRDSTTVANWYEYWWPLDDSFADPTPLCRGEQLKCRSNGQ